MRHYFIFTGRQDFDRISIGTRLNNRFDIWFLDFPPPMPDDVRCQIRCSVCGEWADSRLQFGTAKDFFTSSLIGDTAVCSWCGEITTCDIENVRFDERREGKDGTYVVGKDAMQGRMKK